jgi:hypothetical protein
VFHMPTTNSSPPHLATQSPARKLRPNTAVKLVRQASPAWWPC